MTPGPPLTPGEDLALREAGGWGGGLFSAPGWEPWEPARARAPGAERPAIWYLAGSRQEVQLNIRVSQAVGVHGLQSLQEKRQWSRAVGGPATRLPLGCHSPGRSPCPLSCPSAHPMCFLFPRDRRKRALEPGRWGLRPVTSLPGCVNSGKFLNLSEPRFPRRSNGMRTILLRGGGDAHTISPAKWRAPGECSIEAGLSLVPSRGLGCALVAPLPLLLGGSCS